MSAAPRSLARRPKPTAPDDPAADAAALAGAAAQLGIALDAAQQTQLLAYLGLLRKWNAVYNLTAIRDPGAMRVQHLFDCLAVLPPLRDRPGEPDLLAPGAVVLDVGSGAGLPGVVLAICAPAVQVWCVDAVSKKVAFLTQVRGELGLANLHPLHARVEQLQTPRDLPAPTLLTSRAFASLAQFVALTRHLAAPGATWAAMKGALPEDELQAIPPPIRLRAAITLTVPQLDARRHLLLLGA